MRTKVSEQILAKYPDRIPVIVEKSPNSASDIPEIEKRKFLVPMDINLAKFSFEIRRHMKQLGENQVCFVCHHIVAITSSLSKLSSHFHCGLLTPLFRQSS
jgi:GABA(A) receptor-associated protein